MGLLTQAFLVFGLFGGFLLFLFNVSLVYLPLLPFKGLN